MALEAPAALLKAILLPSPTHCPQVK